MMLENMSYVPESSSVNSGEAMLYLIEVRSLVSLKHVDLVLDEVGEHGGRAEDSMVTPEHHQKMIEVIIRNWLGI